MKNSNKGKYFPLIISIIILLLCSTSMSFYMALGVALFAFLLGIFIKKLGNDIPIIESILFLACLQWIIGPVLDYLGFSNHYKYYMYIESHEYLPFAIMGVSALALGLQIINNKYSKQLNSFYFPYIINHVNNNSKLSYRLIIIGITCSVLQPFAPIFLQFIFYLLGNMKFIGVIYLMYSKDRKKWWVLALIIFFTFTSSLNQAMFHGLILWLMFLGFYYLIIKRISFGKKIVFILIGSMFIYSIQIVKHEFRQYVWFQGYGGNKLTLFWSILNENLTTNSEDQINEGLSESATENMVIRINQGWIISRIMDHIPYEEPYLDGESIKNAIMSTLIPRFLNPNKSIAGGQEYFPRFTGFELTNTSMGPSLLGEGYANYGKTGAIIFLFIVGLFYGLALKILFKMARRYPTLILWIPLLFFQVVKAESDLIRVLNHLVKSGILIALIYWFSYRVLRWRI